jgi:outer membrane protein assembly factor BamB
VLKYLVIFFYFLLGIGLSQNVNLSENQAGSIVYDLLGGIIGNVQVAIQNNKVYIAALRQPYQNSDQGEIILLKSFGSGYIKYGDIGTAYLSCGGFEELLLDDFNNDQQLDVYWQYQCGGNTLNDVNFLIYDTGTNSLYHSRLFTNYSPSSDVEIDENLPSSFLPFIEKRISSHPQFLIPALTEQTQQLTWQDLYGSFTNRETVAITLQENFSPLIDEAIPSTCYVSAAINFNDWQYRSCFKGAVYAVNESQKIYFTVYVPKTAYDWIENLSIDDNLIVIYERDDSSIVTFNPLTFELWRYSE